MDRRLPDKYALPSSPVKDMWNLYVVGIPSEGIAPLRFATGSDFSVQNAAKRFSDFSVLMGMIEAEVQKGRGWSDVVSLTESARMFEIGKVAISLPNKSKRGYQSRNGEKIWTSVLKDLRASKKVPKTKVASKRARAADSEDSNDSDLDDEDEIAVSGVARLASGESRAKK